MSDEGDSNRSDPFEGVLYETKHSDKTHAITVIFKSTDAYNAIDNALCDRYTFLNNKNDNGLEARLLHSGQKVVLTLYRNQTLFIQGKGCWLWKDEFFGSMRDSLREITQTNEDSECNEAGESSRSSEPTSMSECGSSQNLPTSKSPIFYLRRMVSSVRASRQRNKPLPVSKGASSVSATMCTPKTSHPNSLIDNVEVSFGGEQTFVKTLFSSNDEQTTTSPVGNPPADTSDNYTESTCGPPSDDTSSQSSATESALQQQQRENKELQKSLKDLLSQSKLLKSENESLVKLVESKTNEVKVLRHKFDELSSSLVKTENALSSTKAELSKAIAQTLIFEEDITNMKKHNVILTREKADLVEQLMKARGCTDTVEAKIEEASDKLEEKMVTEVNELKKELIREIGELKDQIIKSKAVTCNVNNDKPVSNKQSQNQSVVSNCRDNKQSTVAKRSTQQSAFIAGDSMTRILSTAKMRDQTLDVKVKSHPGGRIRTIENNFIHLAESDPEYLKQLDAVVLHVGTNNVSDGMSCEIITAELRDTISNIQSVSPKAKILVSSIIPRRDDKVVNDIIKKTNSFLQNLCKEKGYFFLNNDSGFLRQNVPNRILYRDNIHLNAKGGKVLGESMRDALNRALEITSSDSNVQGAYRGVSNFHNGRRLGRSPVHPNNRGMVYMPVQPQWMNPWNY